jgi:hypothetical protein
MSLSFAPQRECAFVLGDEGQQPIGKLVKVTLTNTWLKSYLN